MGHAVGLSLAVAALAGCGGGVPSGTGVVPDGTTVSADTYLATSSEAVAAAAELATAVTQFGAKPAPALLKANADRLGNIAGRTRAAGERLNAVRLADGRLDRQRAQLALAYGVLSTAAGDARAAAASGNDTGYRSARIRVVAAIELARSRAAGTPIPSP